MTNIYRVTDGRNHYRVNRSWMKLPEGFELGRISKITIVPDGRIVINQRKDPSVIFFNPDGTYQSSWHHPQLPDVHGIFATSDGNLFLTSFDAHQVMRFDLNGNLTLELGEFNNPTWSKPFSHPTDIAVAPDGEIYVSDGYGNARIHRFTAEGKLIQSWGEPGSEPGCFLCPHGVWITQDNRVITLDRDNSRVQVFDRNGRLLDVWTGFTKPMDIWGNKDDDLFISDQTARIVRLSADGKVLGIIRCDAVYPHGIWGDKFGNIFAAEQLPSNITKFAVETVERNKSLILDLFGN